MLYVFVFSGKIFRYPVSFKVIFFCYKYQLKLADEPKISVLIPAYKEESVIIDNVKRIKKSRLQQS